MLDCDLAQLYGVETAQLKHSVRRNIERFEGDDFMFELTHDELLKCQIGTSSWGGSRYGASAKAWAMIPRPRHRYTSLPWKRRWFFKCEASLRAERTRQTE
ncbi:MAG: ORF6N domain-containing protein [Prevotella sp.]|nr:ORF6N domain-containing protein [Prevotella sp.]